MKLFNTQTQLVEDFVPRGDTVSLYVCGITPYDTTHLGHAFTYTIADILVRYLESKGLKVRYVQNVTDIDDDILLKANQLGSDWRKVGNQWTVHFIRDMQSLNVRPPDWYPRATDVIQEIIQWVQKLLEAGVAYVAGENVYFDITSWTEFGKLSHLPKDDMLPIANERGNHPDDPNKRHPLDFVLWQSQQPGEPAWDSLWGPGRPGWHIECSTMSTGLLGEVVDIHSGGADLCFPHHECEIAQVEPVTNQKPFVRYWMHVAMVRYQGEKMSKSLGNLIWVRELLKTYTSDGIRLYLGGYHYRDSWSYTEDELKRAEQLASLIRLAVSIQGGEGEPLDAVPARNAFTEAMDDDLDTPSARQILDSLAGKIIDAASSGRNVRNAQTALQEMGHIFGLRVNEPEPEEQVMDGWEKHLMRFL